MHIAVAKRSSGSYLMLESGKRINGKMVKTMSVNIGRYDRLIQNNENILEELRNELKKEPNIFYEKYVIKQKLKNTTREYAQKKSANELIKHYQYRINDAYVKVWNKIKLPQLFNKISKKYKIKYSLNDILCYLTTTRIICPKSKHKSFEDKDNYESVRKLNDPYLAQFYRSLDIIAAHKNELEKHLYEQTLKFCSEEDRFVALYDVTTFHFESTIITGLRRFGFSKNNKFNEVQVVYGLMAFANGIPLTAEVFPGNTAEASTLPIILKNIKENLKINTIIVVADRGLNCKENLTAITDAGLNYVVATSIKKLPRSLIQEILSNKPNNSECLELKNTFKVRSYGKLRIVSNRLLIGYSESRASKDIADRERLIKKGEYCVSNPSVAYSGDDRSGKKYVILDRGDKKVIFNYEAVSKDQQFDGLYAISSSDYSLSSDKIKQIYRSLWKIEENFRVMKTNIQTRPIYHKKDEHIEGHLLICFLALYIQRYLEYGLSGTDLQLSIFQLIEKIRASEELIKNVDHDYITQTNDEHKVVLNALNTFL